MVISVYTATLNLHCSAECSSGYLGREWHAIMSVFLRQLSTEDDVTRAQTSSDHFVTFSSMFSPATKPPESLATGALVGIIIGSIFGLLLVSSAILLITTKKRWLALLSVSRGGDFVQQEAGNFFFAN